MEKKIIFTCSNQCILSLDVWQYIEFGAQCIDMIKVRDLIHSIPSEAFVIANELLERNELVMKLPWNQYSFHNNVWLKSFRISNFIRFLFSKPAFKIFIQD